MIGVFGANGFIGRSLTSRLLGEGHRVKAVSRRFDEAFRRGPCGGAELVEADLADRFRSAAALQDVDTVVQMISSSSPALQNNHIMADIAENVVPHVEFLQSCVAAGVRRLVFLSSGGTVYGRPRVVPIPEDHPTVPINSHGVTKLTVEHYVRLFGAMSGIETVIVRLANPFGPAQQFTKGQGLIPAVLSRRNEGRPVRVFGDGSAQRDYVYIDDVTDALVATVTTAGLKDETINIGSGCGRGVLEVIAAMERALGETIAVEHAPARPSDVDRNVLDIGYAARRLGWRPQVPFDEAMRRTVAARA